MTEPYPVVGVFEFPNSQPFEIEDGGVVFPTVEHFYHAMKTTDKGLRKRLAEAATPELARGMGRRIPQRMMRSGWKNIREIVMRSALDIKFHEGTEYHDQLMKTWYSLFYYNRFHDNFWGRCICDACDKISFQNRLGKMLDEIRLRWEMEYYNRRKAYALQLLED